MSERNYLVYFHTPGWGGNEIMALSIINNIVLEGISVDIVCTKEQEDKLKISSISHVVNFLKIEEVNYEKYLKIILILPSFLSFLKIHRKIDKIFDFKIFLYAPFWGWEWANGFSLILRKLLLKSFFYFNKYKFLVIKYDFDKNIIRNSESRIHIIPNFATKKFEVYESCEKNIFCVGRVDFVQKGQDQLIHELIKLKSKNSKIFDNLIFIGDGPNLKELKKSSYNINWIKFLPWVGNSTIQVSSNSICILSSHYEGLPLIALESIMSNIPVIATKGSALNSILPQQSIHKNDMVTLEKSIEYTYRNYEYVLNYSKHNVLSGYSYEAFENSINVLCRD